MVKEGSELFEVGRVVRVHGVKGEVRVVLHDPTSSALETVRLIHLRLRGGGAPAVHAVCGIRLAGDALLVAIEGVHDRDAAAALRGATVFVARGDLPPLAAGELYLADLEGCEVQTRAGAPYGRVHEVRVGGGQDLLVIREGDVERLLPYVPAFVVEVDLEMRRIVVDPPEGLPEERLGR